LDGAKKMARNRGITSSNPNYEPPTGMPAHNEPRDTGSASGQRPATDEDGFPVGSSPTGEERRAKREEAVANLGQQQAAGQTSPPDVSEPTFDGQGNLQLPGSDPVPISELTMDDLSLDSNELFSQYEAETGATITNEASDYLANDYTGALNIDSVVDDLYESREGQYSYTGGGTHVTHDPAYSELLPEGEALADSVGGFFEWIASKDTSETQKMMKMMQTYNVDNRRRDPIVLSNKGGRQR